MTSEEIAEAKAWLASDQPYSEGLRILAAHSKNQNITRIYQGHENRYSGKLSYEIGKLVAMKPIERVDTRKPVQLASLNRPVNPRINLEEIKEVDPGSPKIINRIVAEFSDLYKSRSMALAAMKKVPSDSREESNQFRKILVDKVDAYSTRMDELNHYHELYKTIGTIPDESILYPPKKSLQVIPVENSVKDLLKARTLLVNTLNRNNNMLNFQVISRQPIKNPMPAGPKRTNLLKRIKSVTVDLAKINAQIDGTDKIIALVGPDIGEQ